MSTRLSHLKLVVRPLMWLLLVALLVLLVSILTYDRKSFRSKVENPILINSTKNSSSDFAVTKDSLMQKVMPTASSSDEEKTSTDIENDLSQFDEAINVTQSLDAESKEKTRTQAQKEEESEGAIFDFLFSDDEKSNESPSDFQEDSLVTEADEVAIAGFINQHDADHQVWEDSLDKKIKEVIASRLTDEEFSRDLLQRLDSAAKLADHRYKKQLLSQIRFNVMLIGETVLQSNNIDGAILLLRKQQSLIGSEKDFDELYQAMGKDIELLKIRSARNENLSQNIQKLQQALQELPLSVISSLSSDEKAAGRGIAWLVKIAKSWLWGHDKKSDDEEDDFKEGQALHSQAISLAEEASVTLLTNNIPAFKIKLGQLEDHITSHYDTEHRSVKRIAVFLNRLSKDLSEHKTALSKSLQMLDRMSNNELEEQ